MSDDESWDVTDARGVRTGQTHRRGDTAWPAGFFHVVAGVCVVRGDGLVLLTKRAAMKDHPLSWEFPAGSALVGETSEQAAARELREETGLTALTGSLSLVSRFTEDSALFDLYVTRAVDPSALVLDAEEVADAEWTTLDGVVQRWHAGRMAGPWAPRLEAFWPALVAAAEHLGASPPR